MKAQLKDHPKMKYLGAPSWPPFWSGGSGQQLAPLEGESGTLVAVDLVPPDKDGPRRLRLTRAYQGNDARALLCCDDEAAIDLLHVLLTNNLGNPLKEIGDLEVDL
jgi:hypothetical protein